MKKLYAAILLCLLQLFAAAFAEVEWKEFPYTLHVGGEEYSGVAQVNAKPPEESCNMQTEGKFGTKETAQAIRAAMNLSAEVTDERLIPERMDRNYYFDETRVSFSPATFQYEAGLNRMEPYWGAIQWLDPNWSDVTHVKSQNAVVSMTEGIDWKTNPLVQGTGYEKRIEEVYGALEAVGCSVGRPYLLMYLDVQTLQENTWEEYEFKPEDAAVYIKMPVEFCGYRLKPIGQGTPDGIVNCTTTVEACVTEDEILWIGTRKSIMNDPVMGENQPVISVEEVLKLYEDYLNQMLVPEEGMEEITAIVFEYNMRYTEGEYSHQYEIEPVWSVYTPYECYGNTVMFHALDGREIPW